MTGAHTKFAHAYDRIMARWSEHFHALFADRNTAARVVTNHLRPSSHTSGMHFVTVREVGGVDVSTKIRNRPICDS